MISSNDFRPGVTIELDNAVWQIVEFQHVKPGKGAAFVRAKMKNVKSGAVVERTFNAGEKVPKAHIDKRGMQYLYQSDGYVMMDNETYDQLTISSEEMGNNINFLKENMDIDVMFFQGLVIGVEIPKAVELTVIETDSGIRGDTATGGSKPAKVETGYVVKVPLFINVGDVLKIDTRTGEYLERA